MALCIQLKQGIWQLASSYGILRNRHTHHNVDIMCTHNYISPTRVLRVNNQSMDMQPNELIYAIIL